MLAPLDILVVATALFVPGLYAVLFAWNRTAPGPVVPQLRGWG
jgi:hypothetical protein